MRRVIATVALLVMRDTRVQVSRGPTQVAPSYIVGPCYHATSASFGERSFLTRYDDPRVRAVVLSQLAGMARAGVDAIKTDVWLVGAQSATGNSYKHHFPMTPREAANIRRYTLDVAALRTPSGRPVKLQLAFHYLWCADYKRGEPARAIGRCGLTWPTFVASTKQSVLGTLQAVADVRAPDGAPVVSRVYLESEVMIGAKKNQEKFLEDVYPWFMEKTAELGLEGSLYFNISDTEAHYFDSTFVDRQFPALNGHRSMYWLYRSVEFLKKNNMPVPRTLAFSFYPKRMTRPYAEVVRRVFDDFVTVFPGVHAGLAESYYPPDSATRAAYGRAYALESGRHRVLDEVFFWTTPYENGDGTPVAYPFSFDDLRPVLPVRGRIH
jgi:hypothetical protein